MTYGKRFVNARRIPDLSSSYLRGASNILRYAARNSWRNSIPSPTCSPSYQSNEAATSASTDGSASIWNLVTFAVSPGVQEHRKPNSQRTDSRDSVSGAPPPSRDDSEAPVTHLDAQPSDPIKLEDHAPVPL